MNYSIDQLFEACSSPSSEMTLSERLSILEGYFSGKFLLINQPIQRHPHHTCLHLAASAGNVGVIEFLRNCGADPNVLDRRGSTPLHGAAACGQVGAVEELFKFPNLRGHVVNKDGMTPLDYAKRFQNEKTIATLQRKLFNPPMIRPDNLIIDSLPPIVQSEPSKELLIPPKMLTVDTLLRIVENEPFQELSLAVVKAYFEKFGYDKINAVINEKSGKTLLHIAAFYGKARIVEFLCSHGAAPDQPDWKGVTPLHLAVLSFSQEAL